MRCKCSQTKYIISLQQHLRSFRCKEKRKRKRSDAFLWQKPLHPQTNPKSNVTIQKRHQKNFNYTTIADRFRTVSWCNNSHPTGVVKPFIDIVILYYSKEVKNQFVSIEHMQRACQRTLTPPDTWSCPTLEFACVLMSRPISPELVLSPDFWISNIPGYFSFDCTYSIWP